MKDNKKFDILGKNIPRRDGYIKATGKAKYTDDIYTDSCLIAKVYRSKFANGLVKKIDTKKAESLEGVYLVVTYKDVPKIKYQTSGHPYNVDPNVNELEDKNILTNRVRFYGDEIAAVVAKDEITAEKALKLIEIEYEEYEPILSVQDSLIAHNNKKYIHENGNIIADTNRNFGNYEETLDKTFLTIDEKYETPTVQHCHIEPIIALGYVDENDRVNIITPNQVPFTMQRTVAQAIEHPWGDVRIKKPFVGGGFGAKQDPIAEPLLAFLCYKLKGKKIKLEYTREEVFISRVRHSFLMELTGNFTKEGKLLSTKFNILSNNGAYASHAHAVAETGMGSFRQLYKQEATICNAKTLYTNLPIAGAMRGYGVPQIALAQESMMDDAAYELGIDPIDIRLKNIFEEDYLEPITGMRFRTSGMKECLLKGKELIKWDEKREAYKNQAGDIRKGVGVGAFCYQSHTYPAQLELGSARINLRHDGIFYLEIGATEIGQGSDTAMVQIVAETIGINEKRIFVESMQDTDKSPHDFGSYASRQTFVSGMMVKRAAEIVRTKILEKASEILDKNIEEIDIKKDYIIDKYGKKIMDIDEFAKHTYYNMKHSGPIRVEYSGNIEDNALSFGCTFVDIEVDIKTGEIEIKEIYNIHDSGKILNPILAEGQVQGGMSMGLGFALYEELLFDKKGKPLNDNLLDYKLMTILDTPDLKTDFVETIEPTSAYGNKCIGEPPTIPEGPALRNALFNAIGVKVNKLPLTPQRVYEEILKQGIK